MKLTPDDIIRRIKRLRIVVSDNKKKYDGHETDYTFHGGWNCGYYEGLLAALEDLAHSMEIEINE